MKKMIDKQFYNKQGYYVAKNIISKKLIEAYLNDFSNVVENTLRHHNINCSNDLFENLQNLLQYDTKLYLTCIRLTAKFISLKTILHHQDVISLVKQLGITLPIMQYQPVTHINSPQLQIKGGYDGLQSHQDFTSLQSSLDCMTLWIPFFDVTNESCSLDILPGSHLQGLMAGEIAENAFVVDDSSYRDEDFVTLELDAGDVLCFNAFTVHRTQKNRQNVKKLRFAASCRYENAQELTFIERGYPCRETKTMEREILFPNFPDKETVQQLFLHGGDN